MSLRIGLYEFFAYTIPGVFYIIITMFALTIFGFVQFDLERLLNLSLFSFLVLLGAGYITGLLIDSIAYRWYLLFINRQGAAKYVALEEFLALHPWVILDYKPEDWSILLNAVKNKSIDTAMDIEQHNVASIMLRNISLSFMLISIIFLLRFIIVNPDYWNLIIFGFTLLLSIIAIRRSKRRRHWFYMGIFDAFVAIYYLPDKNTDHISKGKSEGSDVDIVDDSDLTHNN